MSAKSATRVVIANKNKLVSAALKSIISADKRYNVVYETNSGKDLLKKLNTLKPGIVITGIGLKDLNGYYVVTQLEKNNSGAKVLVLADTLHPYAAGYMLKHNANGFVSVDTDEKSFIKALTDVHTKGMHYSRIAPKQLLKSIQEGKTEVPEITEKQLMFLNYCCTELSYNEIAKKMKVSLRTIDWHRDTMFSKLGLTNRTDLVMFALRTGLVQL